MTEVDYLIHAALYTHSEVILCVGDTDILHKA